MHYAFQTETKLYFIIDFMNGGELFTYLKREKRFEEKRVKIYAAELVEAISYLHSQGIVYRDLKPENILLDSLGHLKMTDFGLSKIIDRNTTTESFCGTPEYIAPEIIMQQGHDFRADWYSLGALMYEMLTGKPPHYNKNKTKLMTDATETDAEMKPYFSEDVNDLLSKLLARDPKQRLGTFVEGAYDDAEEIRSHPFFFDIDWELVKHKKHKAAFVP